MPKRRPPPQCVECGDTENARFFLADLGPLCPACHNGLGNEMLTNINNKFVEQHGHRYLTRSERHALETRRIYADRVH